MYRFTLSEFDEENLDKSAIRTLITEHESMVGKLRMNKDYYEGRHMNPEDGEPRVICNHAKDISDTATGYFMGSPITYQNSLAETESDEQTMDELLQAFDDAGVNDTDTDLALDASIYGLAYEYVYTREGTTDPVSKSISPEHAFIVVDDSIEERELCGVYYWRKEDSAKKTFQYVALVTTDHYTYTYTLHGSDPSGTDYEESVVEHLFGEPQIIEYLNNKDAIGDFEQQITLMDAYDALISDRIIDKQQYVDAILLLYGANLGDDEEETTEAQKKLKRDKLLELPPDAKAEYLTRQMDESGAEILRKALKEDIYNFSHVPNFQDENFAGNVSGVAMEYKLLGLEMMTKVKEKYYKKGLRKRIRMFCHALGLETLEEQAGSILITFSRGLPKNLSELAQIVTLLSGHVSEKTLLQLLPFVEDPQMEIEAAEEQKQEEAERLRQTVSFRFPADNTPLEE